MKAKTLFTTAAASTLFALAALGTTQNAAEPSGLDEALSELARRDEFSGVVLVARDGKPIFRKAYGQASRRYGAPNGIDTRFNLGSIDKYFTKVAIGQLLAAGKLSLDGTVAEYLPDYRNREVAGKITVQHLLEHRSGLGDIFGETFDRLAKDQLRTPSDYLAVFAQQPLLFEPGTEQRYSNFGYIVLGAIIEAITGEDYHDYVREHVFEPAGMPATGPVAADAEDVPVAIGYTRHGREDGPWRSNAFTVPFFGTPAGGGYSTVDDLASFVDALTGHRLLPPAYTEWYFDGEVAETPGWRPDEFIFGGGGEGVHAMVWGNGGYTVVVLANLDPPAARTAMGAVQSALPGEASMAILHGGRPAPGSRPPYRIGAGIDIEVQRGSAVVSIAYVEPDGPAERAGLRAGDVLVAINGQPVTDEPLAQLDPLLVGPTPIELSIERDGEGMTVAVTPEPLEPKRKMRREPASG